MASNRPSSRQTASRRQSEADTVASMHLTDIYGRLPGTQPASVLATPAAVLSSIHSLNSSSAPPNFDHYEFQPNGLLPLEALPLRVPIPSTGSAVSFSYNNSVPAHRIPLPPSVLSTPVSRYSGGARPSLARFPGGAHSLHPPGSVRVFSPTRVLPSIPDFSSLRQAPPSVRTVFDPPPFNSPRIHSRFSPSLPDFLGADSNFPSHAPSHATVGTFFFGDDPVPSVTSYDSMPQPVVGALATPFVHNSRLHLSRAPSVHSPLFMPSPSASSPTVDIQQFPRLPRHCYPLNPSTIRSVSVHSPLPNVQVLRSESSLSSRPASSSSGRSSVISANSRPATPARVSPHLSVQPVSVAPSVFSALSARSRASSSGSHSSSSPHVNRLPVAIPRLPIPNTKFIPILTGSGDWHSWHMCIQTAAVSSGVANHLIGPICQDDLPFLDLPYESAERPSYPPPRVNLASLPHHVFEWDTWWDKDNIARYILTSRLGDSVAKSIDMGTTFNVGRDRTARHIFADLFRLFGGGDYSSAMVAETQLRALYCGPSVSVSSYVNTWRVNMNQMAGAGHPMPLRQAIQLFIDGLPTDQYAYQAIHFSMQTHVNTLPDAQLPTLAEVFEDVIMAENSIASRQP